MQDHNLQITPGNHIEIGIPIHNMTSVEVPIVQSQNPQYGSCIPKLSYCFNLIYKLKW